MFTPTSLDAAGAKIASMLTEGGASAAKRAVARAVDRDERPALSTRSEQGQIFECRVALVRHEVDPGP